jgi:pimeloyl-ACP methyl ester carboxylesterase
MATPADSDPPLGRTENASRQLERAVRFISMQHGVGRISLIAHSWGSIVAGRLAGRCPDLIDRLVFFGPIAQRPRQSDPPRLPAWRLITLKDQWDRFVSEVPPGQRPVLERHHVDQWAKACLDIDPNSRIRSPAAVQTPSGAFQDIFDAWAGELAYDPALVRAPVAIIRGEWDRMCSASDAAWLFDALRSSPQRRVVTISRATHLMHLEQGRFALYRECEALLKGGNDVDRSSQPAGEPASVA